MAQANTSTCDAGRVLKVYGTERLEEGVFIEATILYHKKTITLEAKEKYALETYLTLHDAGAILKQYLNPTGGYATLEQCLASDPRVSQSPKQKGNRRSRDCLGWLLSCTMSCFTQIKSHTKRSAVQLDNISEARSSSLPLQTSGQDNPYASSDYTLIAADNHEQRESVYSYTDGYVDGTIIPAPKNQCSDMSIRHKLGEVSIIILIESVDVSKKGIYAMNVLYLDKLGYILLMTCTNFGILIEEEEITRQVRAIMGPTYHLAEHMHNARTYIIGVGNTVDTIYTGFPIKGAVRDTRHRELLLRGERIGYQCLFEAQECM